MPPRPPPAPRSEARFVAHLAAVLGACAATAATFGCKPTTAPPRVLPADPVDVAVMPGASLGDLDRGVAFVTNHAFKDAIPYFDRALRADPKNAQAHYYRALCREETNDASGAVEDYRAALAIDPTFVDPAVNLGALYLKDPARPAEAIAVLAPAAAKHPEETDLASNLAFAYQLNKEFDKSAAAFDQALRAAAAADASLNTGPTGVPGPPAGIVAELEFRYGNMLVEANQDTAAATHLNKALPGYAKDAPTLVTIAHLLAQSKAYADCVKAFDTAIALKSDEAEWYIQRGVCKHEGGNEEAARNDYEAALKVKPNDPEAYYALGRSFLKDKKRLNAVDALQKAVKYGGPENPFAQAAQKLVDRIAAEQKAQGH